MSILVKGMEMPKNCFLCPLSVLSENRLFCELTSDEVVRAKIDGDCPLVEVDGNEIDEAIKALKGVRDAYRIITEAFCRPQETDIGSKPK